MRTGLAIVGLGLLAVGAREPQGQAVTPATGQQIFVPPGSEAAYDTVHYAPVVRVGETVVVSGVAAVGPGEFEDQVRRMFDRIKTNLAAAGASMGDVVELQTFHRGGPDSAAFQAEFRRFRAVHDEYFTDHYPAWTAIGNVALLAPGALVETRVMAIVGSGAHATVHRGAGGLVTGAPQVSPGQGPPAGGVPSSLPDPALLAPHAIDLAPPTTVAARLLSAIGRPLTR
jgi:enamine deaminase RidA (YjgF/YER057c/UK114 family)